MSNYRYEGYGVVRDLKSDIPYHTDDIVDLLEEKDIEITELKSQPAEIVEKIKETAILDVEECGIDPISYKITEEELNAILKEYQK